MFYAHSGTLPDRSDWQPLKEHLEQVAAYAHDNAEKFGAGEWGRIAGLLHDIGKYSDAFQIERLTKKDGRRVDHSTAGAQIAVDQYKRLGKLLAFCLAGHHAGLANGESGDTITALNDRLENRDIPARNPLWQNEICPLPDVPPLPRFDRRDPERAGFQLAFFTRMLFSCLVDADRRDTAAHYDRLNSVPPRSTEPALEALRVRLDGYLERLASRAVTNGASTVNAERSRILAHVRAKSSEPPGLFSLTVPTGGGKTLASLAFALDHAIAHGLDRVVYVTPFTSIIEQTADVFREALGDLSSAVLEHHSALDWEDAVRRTAEADERDGERELRLAMESWDKPVVVTTAVQFFESLFSNRTTKCRKLHNIARSVVILDEAQKLPLPLLRPCVAALDELALNYKTSIVLCTATQPAIVEDKALPEGGFKGGVRDVRELAPDPKVLYRAFRRVTVEHAGTLDDASLTERLKGEDRVLCIVNSRAHARALFDAIRDEPGARHLTTLMCAKHRSKILKEIKQDLTDGKPCRLVATSLVEAGVDVDFPTVYRAEAGIDSIAQAAGRCNREGRRTPEDSRVIVFETPDHKGPHELQQFSSIGRSVARRHAEDMLSLEAVEAYFRDLYWLKDRGANSELDAASIIQRLHNRAHRLDFEFESIARDFQMIDSVMVPVIIPWDDDAKRALRDLEHADKVGGIARRLQPYLAQVRPQDRAALIESGAAYAVRPEVFGDQFIRLSLLKPKIYDDHVGLRDASDVALGAATLII